MLSTLFSTTIGRYVSIALGVLIAGLMAAGLFYRTQAALEASKVAILEHDRSTLLASMQEQTKAYTVLVATQKVSEEAIKERDARVAELNKKKVAQDAKLKEALKQNHAWADVELPADIRSSLFNSTGPTKR